MSAIIITFITVIAASVAAVMAVYFWPRARALAITVLAWFAAALILNFVGIFSGQGEWVTGDIARMMFFTTAMVLPLAGYLWIRFKRADLMAVINAVPLPAVAGIQVYRAGGFIYLMAVWQGVLPPEVGVSTGILDAFIGLTALPLAYALSRWGVRSLVIGWNVIGLMDLCIALSVISLSIFGLMTVVPAPSAIGQSPFILICLFQVPLAIICHIELLRRLPELKRG